MKIVQTLLATLLIAGTERVLAQSFASASVGGAIIEPMSMGKNEDLYFGRSEDLIASTDPLVLSPGNAGSNNSRNSIGAPPGSRSANAASFTISGVPGFTYAISLPGNAVIRIPGAGNMTVTAFTSVPSATGTISAGGTQTLYIGATLSVSSHKTEETNTKQVPISVDYN